VVVIMEPGAGSLLVAAVAERIAGLGLVAQTTVGVHQTIVAALGETAGRDELDAELAELPGVERVVRISRPYKLSSIEATMHEPTTLHIGGREIGPSTFCMIAGPCTVESREQTFAIAESVAAAGASMLRGGAFKPRTSPFAFQGLGREALEILSEARDMTGLPIVSELLDITQADLFRDHVDVIQIGARNMQNYTLLREIGQMGMPVVLKRGLSATIDELLQAADYLLRGTEQVILCERGIRTFETATRFTLDLSAIPALRQRTHLPVIVDPSHASGDRRLVGPLAAAAAAVGADGLLVEVHDDPTQAHCDGPQQLATADFGGFVERIAAHAALAGRTLA
jgi:3-deoxy-7-phosphoheptulonate synthase